MRIKLDKLFCYTEDMELNAPKPVEPTEPTKPAEPELPKTGYAILEDGSFRDNSTGFVWYDFVLYGTYDEVSEELKETGFRVPTLTELITIMDVDGKTRDPVNQTIIKPYFLLNFSELTGDRVRPTGPYFTSVRHYSGVGQRTLTSWGSFGYVVDGLKARVIGVKP